ncbi:unnamed protein product [Euphydryas editha]|uniref:Uncharacterized protein n=1 Tax=Euphydryas editha TaxID=104508 RepID=A0AAU9TNE4_EUPED|nr:unnamed protein product [Euphydryas editha]
MSAEFKELSAIDFLLFMDNVDSLDLIRSEYYIIEQNRKICEENVRLLLCNIENKHRLITMGKSDDRLNT